MERSASTNFISGDPRDGPMPMDYFVYLARSEERMLVIDTEVGETTRAARP